VSYLTLDSNPVHLLPSMGSEPVDKSKDPSIESTQTRPGNIPDGQNPEDRFEQARMAFFSKQAIPTGGGNS
jgi:hypothetical protein